MYLPTYVSLVSMVSFLQVFTFPDCRGTRILALLDQGSDEERQVGIQEEQIDDPNDIDFDPQEIQVDQL